MKTEAKKFTHQDFVTYLEELKKDGYIDFEVSINWIKKPDWCEMYFKAWTETKDKDMPVTIENTIKVFSKSSFNYFKRIIALRLQLKFKKSRKHDKNHV